MGTVITETMNNKTNVDMKIQAADTAMIVLLAAGFTSWRLLPAEDRVLMIKMYIIPKVISGLNCFIINQDNEANLIKFGNKMIAAMHLIAGTLPLNIHISEDVSRESISQNIDIATGKIGLKTSWTIYILKILKIHGCQNQEKLLRREQ